MSGARDHTKLQCFTRKTGGCSRNYGRKTACCIVRSEILNRINRRRRHKIFPRQLDVVLPKRLLRCHPCNGVCSSLFPFRTERNERRKKTCSINVNTANDDDRPGYEYEQQGIITHINLPENTWKRFNANNNNVLACTEDGRYLLNVCTRRDCQERWLSFGAKETGATYTPAVTRYAEMDAHDTYSTRVCVKTEIKAKFNRFTTHNYSYVNDCNVFPFTVHLTRVEQ